MSVRRLALRGGLAATALWAAGCATVYQRAFGQRRWGPEADRGWTPDDLGVEHERLPITTTDGVELLAWHLPGRAPAAVIVCPGHRGRAGDVLGISAALQRAGLSVTALGWRGTPGSGAGRHTLGSAERLDLKAGVAATRERTGGVPLGVLGFSMGGAVALGCAAEEPLIAAVCADSAFSDAYAVLDEGVRRVLHLPGPLLTRPAGAVLRRRTGGRLPEVSPVASIAAIPPRPLLLIHVAADRSVPVEHARRLAAAAGGASLWVVEGAPHCGAYFADRAEYRRRVGGFFVDALLRGAPSSTS